MNFDFPFLGLFVGLDIVTGLQQFSQWLDNWKTLSSSVRMKVIRDGQKFFLFILLSIGFITNLSANRYDQDGLVGSVYFALSSAEISAASRKDMLKMISRIPQIPNTGYRLRVVGFADSTGDARENMVLGLKRAENVAQLLKKELGLQDYAIVTSWGERTARYSARDRRVDIFFDRSFNFSESGTVPMLVVMFLIAILLAAVVIFGRRSRA